ncbi:MAG: outer membrane beta-barrel protein, partial [Bryobacteraceae bacterium]
MSHPIPGVLLRRVSLTFAIVLNGALLQSAHARVSSATDDNPTAPKEISNVASPTAREGFWKRFAAAYWADWHPAAAAKSSTPASPPAEPQYRGYPPSETDPPYPFSTWPMGGTVAIGYNNATAYPLTTALQNGPHGDWWKRANVQVYGWFDLGMNISTSNKGEYANAPAAYDQMPNAFQVDQVTLYFERTPDTIQTDHFDWGFRLTNLYGSDYRFTTAEGYVSQQLLNNPKANGTIGNKYGYDPVMAYVDLYFPGVAQGMDVRIGRYISLPDIEAQLAPNN